MFTITKENIIGAIVSGVLMAILTMGYYILSVGSIFKVDFAHLLDIGTLSLITSIVSIVKNFLSTPDGKFLGTIKVVDSNSELG